MLCSLAGKFWLRRPGAYTCRGLSTSACCFSASAYTCRLLLLPIKDSECFYEARVVEMCEATDVKAERRNHVSLSSQSRSKGLAQPDSSPGYQSS